jgi:EmrB/QacA subfamily drug resistance transporter
MMSSDIDYSRKWLVMLAVSMGTLQATINTSIVNVALPTLVRELETDFSTIQWVMLAYLLTATVLMLSVGRLADMVGKKQIFTIGLALFTLGSLLCGLSPNVNFLILFRVFQAIGATMIMALGVAIVTESFPPNERGKALGVIGTMVSIGIAIGPTLGGIILELASWNWIFFVNLPVGILGIILVNQFVPNLKPKGRQSFDFVGAITLFLSLISLLFALTVGQNNGFGDYRTIALFCSWLVFLVLFVYIENHSAQPMLHLGMFRNPLFSINLVTGFLVFVVFSGIIILLPFFLETIMNYGTRQVGLLLAVFPASMGIVAPIAGSLSDRFGTRRITLIGLGCLLIGYLAFSSINSEMTSLSIVSLLLPIGIGMGVFVSPNNSAIMGASPPDSLGLVSGILSLTRSLGQSTGIAVIGAIWASLAIAASRPLSISSVTEAPPWAQVSALQQTFIVGASVILVAFLLALWAVIREQKANKYKKEVDGDQWES